jgi:hypothetical protein
MHEIDRLPPGERSKVVRYAKQLDAHRQLTPDELTSLANEMADAADPVEASRLKEEIIKGFYGGE